MKFAGSMLDQMATGRWPEFYSVETHQSLTSIVLRLWLRLCHQFLKPHPNY